MMEIKIPDGRFKKVVETKNTLADLLESNYNTLFKEMVKDRTGNFGKFLEKSETIEMGNIEARRKPSYQHYGYEWKFYHCCGSEGGKYRINNKGNCYKCKEQIAPYKNLVMAVKLVKFNEPHERKTAFKVSGIGTYSPIKKPSK
jgi:hypothetical protein